MLYLNVMKNLKTKLIQRSAQTAIEYLILLSLVAVIVMFSFSNLFPRANQAVSSLFLRAGSSIMGEKVQPIDGSWCDWGPCQVEGNQTRLCDCPAPLGSGTLCPGSSRMACSIDDGGGGEDGGGDDDDGD